MYTQIDRALIADKFILHRVLLQDPFGAAAIQAGLTVETLKAWSIDPQVKGESIFDQLEDKNAKECLETMVLLNTN
jgi:hypothetical protein